MSTYQKLSRTAKTKRGPGYRIGETHHRAKLSDNDVRLIRLLRECGLNTVEIASKFNCSPSNISAITNYKSRKLRLKFFNNEKE